MLVSLVLTLAAFGSDGDGSSASDRADDLPTSKPLARVGRNITRLHRLTLAPRGPRAKLGEYHDTHSFAPNRRTIAFGISAPAGGGSIGDRGRVGIRLIKSRNLTVSANIQTGVYGAALAWLEPSRLVALLGVGGVVPLPPPPHHGTVLTLDPATGEVLEEDELPFGDSRFHCDATEARGRALIVLAGQRLFVIDSNGSVETIDLPPDFATCGQVALAPGGERVFVVAEGEDVVAEIELATQELIVHELPAGLRGKAEAIALGAQELVLAHRAKHGRPKGVELIDTENESRMTIDPKAGAARVVEGTVLTFDGRPLRRAAGIGVRGYGPDGTRRFRLLKGKRIAKVETTGRFAYAMRRRRLAIIDVFAGTVVSRSSKKPPLNAELLTDP